MMFASADCCAVPVSESTPAVLSATPVEVVVSPSTFSVMLFAALPVKPAARMSTGLFGNAWSSSACVNMPRWPNWLMFQPLVIQTHDPAFTYCALNANCLSASPRS